ncbi:MAG: nucleotidyltransferase domain-containing protein [Bacteriovoracaceae bacterium]|nr:nucleotidyltransferase domain-containing protein [Bacteriovoracaceae bacterium]
MIFGVEEKHLNTLLQYIKNNLGSTINPRLYLYGSRAKGNFRPYSDIDLLLIADRYDENTLNKMDFGDLDIPYKIDFTTEPKLFSGYKEEIFSHMTQILF